MEGIETYFIGERYAEINGVADLNGSIVGAASRIKFRNVGTGSSAIIYVGNIDGDIFGVAEDGRYEIDVTINPLFAGAIPAGCVFSIVNETNTLYPGTQTLVPGGAPSLSFRVLCNLSAGMKLGVYSTMAVAAPRVTAGSYITASIKIKSIDEKR